MTPYDSGMLIGTMTVAVVPTVFLILNIIAMQRRRTNSRCALSVILTCAGWLIAALGAFTARTFALPPLAHAIAGLVMLGCILSGIVLAIIGLVEMKRRPRRYDRGRKRAVSILVISLLFFGLVGYGFYMGATGRRPFGRTPKVIASSGQPIKNDAWNFRLEVPSPWIQNEPLAVHPHARAAISRRGPEMYALVVTEDLTHGGNIQIADAVQVVKTNLKGAGSAEFLAEEDWHENGLSGRRLESLVKQGPMHLAYVHHIVLNNGTFYQLVTWGPANAREQIREDSRRLASGFHFLDPKRSVLAESERAPATFASRKFGYTIDLTNTVWTRRWAALAEDNRFAEFGVMNPTGSACFSIIPVWVGDNDLDLDVLTHALAARVGVPYPHESVYGVRDLQVGMLRGRALAFERSHNGTDFLFRLRVLRGRGFAYLLAAWMDRKTSSLTDLLDEAMDGVRFAEKVDPDPLILSDQARAAHASVWNDIGIALDNAGRTDAALPWIQRAFEVDRTSVTPLLNYADLSIKAGKAADALAYLDKHIGSFSGNQQLAARRANAQVQSGDMEGGLKSYGALFDAGWRNDAEFAGYIRELSARKRHDDALAALDRYTKGYDKPALQRLRAEALLEGGRKDEAISILTEARKNSPNDNEIALALTDTYYAAERFTDAIAECDRMIAEGRESAYVLRRRGLAEFSLKRYREAKTSLEKAHQRDPADQEIKRMLDHVSGMLGEGGNSTVKKSIDPVSLPSLASGGDTADPDDPYLRGYSAWYRSVVRAISFEKGREFKTTDQMSIQIRDQQGVEKFSTLEFRFDPLGEEIFVNAVTVKGGDGKVIAHGRVEDSYVVDDGVGETATQAKILHVPVPALQPGNTLEYTVTRRETGSAKAFSFQTYAFARGLPTLRSVLHLEAPREAVKWEATSGVPAPKKSGDTLTWVFERPAVYRYEPLQAPVESFVPMVWLGDSSATWPGEAKEYLTQIKDRRPIDADIRAAAARTTEGLTKPEEKTATLARFVQRELTYKAIEFGRRARMPNSATQTLRNKYGDCKDHALLLSQLLESAGVPAQLALISSGNDLRPGLPSLDQFDHMVTFLPGKDGGSFIDCTSKTSDLRSTPPYGLATRQALVLDEDEPRLKTVPPYAAGSSSVVARREVSFRTETDVEVDETLTLTGVAATSMRAVLLAIEPAQRTRYLLQMLVQKAPSLELQDAQVEKIDDPQTPLGLRLRYVIRHQFQEVGGQLIGKIPAIWERLHFAGDPVEQRLTPFRIWVPTRFESHVSVKPPAGWQATPAEPRRTDAPFCTVTTNTRQDQPTLHIESVLIQGTGQFPPAQYAAYLESTSNALTAVERGLVLRREEK